MKDRYSKRNYWVIYLIPLLSIILRLSAAPYTNISYFLVALYALLGRFQSIQALALSWLFTMINPGIAGEASQASIGRYAILVAAIISNLFHNKFIVKHVSVKPATGWTLLLGMFFVIHSIIFSPFADVSALKAISWALTIVVLIAAWSGLETQERETLARQIFGGLIVIMLVSLPLVVTNTGYLRNGSGFQGILNHPQAFGPTMALLCAWAASKLFGEKKPSWFSIALVVSCLVMIMLSKTRTAGLAVVLGVGIAVVVVPGLSGSTIRALLPGLRSRRVYLVAAICLVGVMVFSQKLSVNINQYIAKGGSSSNLTDAYDSSRGHLMRKMLANISDNPLQGIGFGIASDPASMDIQRDSVLGLPTGAPIEKGVLLLAIIEEVGVIGFAFVAIWLCMLLRGCARGGVTPLAVVMTALLINMGESTFFSPGGLGLLFLILFGWAYACGQEQEARP